MCRICLQYRHIVWDYYLNLTCLIPPDATCLIPPDATCRIPPDATCLTHTTSCHHFHLRCIRISQHIHILCSSFMNSRSQFRNPRSCLLTYIYEYGKIPFMICWWISWSTLCFYVLVYVSSQTKKRKRDYSCVCITIYMYFMIIAPLF